MKTASRRRPSSISQGWSANRPPGGQVAEARAHRPPRGGAGLDGLEFGVERGRLLPEPRAVLEDEPSPPGRRRARWRAARPACALPVHREGGPLDGRDVGGPAVLLLLE